MKHSKLVVMKKKMVDLEKIHVVEKSTVHPPSRVRSIISSLNNFFKFSLYHEKIEAIKPKTETNNGYIYNIEIEIDLLNYTPGKQKLPELLETIERLHSLIKKITDITIRFEMDACLHEKIKEILDKKTVKNEIIQAIHHKVYQVKNKFFPEFSSFENNTDIVIDYVKKQLVTDLHLEKEYIFVNIFSGLFDIDIHHFIKVFTLYEISHYKGREMLENDLRDLLVQKNTLHRHKKRNKQHLIQMLIEQYPDSESNFIEKKASEKTDNQYISF